MNVAIAHSCQYIYISIPSNSSWIFRRDKYRFYAACVLEALAYMHARGVAYRDLKVSLELFTEIT